MDLVSEPIQPVGQKSNKEVNPTESLTKKLYALSWSDYFPLHLDSGFTVQVTDLETVRKFSKDHYFKIHQIEHHQSFLSDGYSEKKLAYYQHAGDFFLFLKDGVPMGTFCGTPIDWSSYYLRDCSLLQECRGNQLLEKMISYLTSILKKHGLERVETDAAPTNPISVHVLNKLGFYMSSLSLTDRWGSLLRFTLFLNHESKSIFENQFCYTAGPQQNKVLT